ncbi:hypothetical protein EZS27_000221 [termite gut metagenome]|jgi:hypothetical protein|uniref:Tetratricopeptide repeat protein n=1 Tax=termite gut metagenome TaxID=433724 RepID=A0A5J4T3E2_9ZZZZ
MTASTIQQWISSPELLNENTLRELRSALREYPYSQTLWLLYLKNLYLLCDGSFSSELRKGSLYVNDRCALFYLIEGDEYRLRLETASTDEGADRTLKLIDAFLSQTAEQVPVVPDELKYTADYIPYLLNEDNNRSELPDAPKLHKQELIDDFIEKSKDKPLTLHAIEEISLYPVEEPFLNKEESEEKCFTETLAKIYIKQKKYTKALEIIKNLSMKNPKKDAYFADQIRFLEKLITNTKS